jgi:plastocyanin
MQTLMQRRRRSALLLIAGLLTVALTALPTVTVAQSDPAPMAMVEADPTDINAWGFAATVPVGGTVTWTNQGTQEHSVTSADGSFDSGLVTPGTSATIRFDTPGIYAYACTPHPWMKGFVVVAADVASVTPMAMVEGSPTDINSWGFATSIQPGQSVVWTNRGSQAHSATAADGSFDAGLISPGSTGQVVFDVPGIYAYACSPHPWMKASVSVK